MLEKTLESPLDCKEIQPVHSKGDHSWVFFGRNDAKAETPVLWPPYVKSWLIGKDSDAGRDWGQEEKGMTEDELAGWPHRLDGRESEWTPGVGDGQGGLACCNSWSRKELDTTERLNWTDILRVELTNWIWSISIREGAINDGSQSFLARGNGRIGLPFIEMRNSTRGIGLGGCGGNVGLGIQFWICLIWNAY